MNDFAAYRTQLTLERDRLKLVKAAAKAYQNSHTPAMCYATGMELYQSDNFQIQEVGVFLLGYAAQSESGALAFLRETVSSHEKPGKFRRLLDQWPSTFTARPSAMKQPCL